MYIPTFDDVITAHDRIRPYIHRTPVLTSSYLNGLTGAELFFKCENLQKAGAFKARGASNAVFGLTDEQARKGVATHSRAITDLPCLCGRPARHSLHRRHAAHRAAGQEGRRERLWRSRRRMRALNLLAVRPSLPRSSPRPAPNSCTPTTTIASSPGRRPARRN
jgi:hypothetical protein